MNAKDEKHIKKIIEYCEATASDIEYFGDDFNEYLTNDHYQRACAFNIIQIGEYIVDCPMSSKTSIQILLGIV